METNTPAAETPASPFTDDAARDTWLQTGKMPGDSADQPAASATAPAGDTAASTDATVKGASETPDPEREKGAAVKARNAELQMEIERNAELLRLRAEQRKQLRESGQNDTTKPAAQSAESAPAAAVGLTKDEYKRFLAMPGAPKLGDFQEIEEHTAAMALFIGQQIAESTFDRKFGEISKTATERDARLRDVNEHVSAADAAYKAYLERTPDAEQKINPRLVEIVPASLLENPAEAKPHNVLADFVMKSGVPGELHEYFSTPDGTKHWQSLLAMTGSRDRVAFEFGKLSARFDSRAAIPATPPKTVSSAPEPVTEIGKRPTKTLDDAEAALLSGDPSAYQEAMNRRDWEARRSA